LTIPRGEKYCSADAGEERYPISDTYAGVPVEGHAGCRLDRSQAPPNASGRVEAGFSALRPI
jgi:hypothetical protein